MSSLLRKYIRETLTEISAKKVMKKILAPNAKNIKNFRADQGFTSQILPGRIGKKWFQENSDQQWLNGEVENIVALHTPVGFSIKEYPNYEMCKLDMLMQYPCNTFIKNEQSALGFLNRKAEEIDTDTFLSEKLKEFDSDMFHGISNILFLHLSPRRITHAASVDSETNTYKHFPKLTPISLKDWNNITIKEFMDRYENHIEPVDFRFLARNVNKPIDDERANSILNDMKEKYKYLRIYADDPSYNYFESRQSSGARKFPFHYTTPFDITTSYYDKLDILDFEDWKYEVDNYDKENPNILEDIMGEIIVGNFKINAVWVNVNLINQNDFNKWMSGEYSDEFINFKYSFPNVAGLLKIQEFYRLKYFIECGVKVNYYSDLQHQYITDEYLLDNLRDKLKIVDEKGLIALDYKGDVMKQSVESFNKYLKSNYSN